jgi:putative PIN family toxin of toxin-antitoxin system
MRHYAVIDTNTWLDLLLFRNPGSNALAYALKQGTIVAIATQEMQDELDEVLRRPVFLARHPDPASLLRVMLRWTKIVAAPTFLSGPACKDKADQKFIDLAVTYPAQFLISKDQAILRLAHKMKPCQTGLPELFQCIENQPVLLMPSRGQQQRVLKLEFEGTPLGQVRLERWGSMALLRGLAVEPEYQRQGVGTALVLAAEAVARAAGARSLYLFTETAQAFFLQLGYHQTARESAPAAIQHSDQFLHSCPASAVLMLKSLASVPSERDTILS